MVSLDARILVAARDGDLKTLREIASKASDIEEFRRTCEVLNNDWEGHRALHIAAEYRWTSICQFLIEEVNVDIDLKTDHGITPLQLAIHHGCAHTAKYLINRGADTAMTDSEGMTPLHYATRKCDLELMELLLSKGAKMEAKSVHGTPLQIATSTGNADSVNFLLVYGAKPNSITELVTSPLMLALCVKSMACVGALLRAGADPNFCPFILTPLAYAAQQGVWEYVSYLLNCGANPNKKDALELVPIEHAGFQNNEEAVKRLFPVSERIEGYDDWSVDGIIQYLRTEQGRKKRSHAINVRLWEYKHRGIHAMITEDFRAAVKWYSMAIELNSSDTLLKLYRSMCFSHLNEAELALNDAKECTREQPDSTRANYREGLAWWQLGNYRMASCAFLKAYELDRKNEAIKHAWKVSTVVGACELYSKYRVEFMGHMERRRRMGLRGCCIWEGPPESSSSS